jgi:hypothetical protein
MAFVDYESLRLRATRVSKRPEDPRLEDYFPVDHSISRLLQFFGDLLGMRFLKLLPEDKNYQSTVKGYLKSKEITARSIPLDVFCVSDTTGLLERPLGFLLLDAKERARKAHRVYCQTFGRVSDPSTPECPRLSCNLL